MEIEVPVRSQSDVRRKWDAFIELFGKPPQRARLHPLRVGTIPIKPDSEIWGSAEIAEVHQRQIVFYIDGELRTKTIDWTVVNDRIEEWPDAGLLLVLKLP